MNALNTKIIQGTYRDYYWLFGDERTAYTNLVAKSAAGKNGALYMMLADGKPAEVRDNPAVIKAYLGES